MALVWVPGLALPERERVPGLALREQEWLEPVFQQQVFREQALPARVLRVRASAWREPALELPEQVARVQPRQVP